MLDLWEQFQTLWQTRRTWLVAGGSVLVLLVGVFGWQTTHSAPAVATALTTTSSQTSTSQASSATSQATIMVDVKGAVTKPGVYTITSLPHVQTAIAQAGGARRDADMTQVNLAAVLQDGQVVYVPAKGETTPSTYANSTSAATSTTAKVNLNTATSEELQTISGVGPSKAQKIIDYRTQNGGFQSVDDLKKVGGFGDKTVAALRDYVTVQ